MKHTQTTLYAGRQGIEIQSTEPDDFGSQTPGPHELYGEVGGVSVTIAAVPSGKSIFTEARPNGEVEPTYTISESEAIANLQRLAHCWNCHDDLVRALAGVIRDIDIPGGSVRTISYKSVMTARAALDKASGAA